jgi:hypothetical protein
LVSGHFAHDEIQFRVQGLQAHAGTGGAGAFDGGVERDACASALVRMERESAMAWRFSSTVLMTSDLVVLDHVDDVRAALIDLVDHGHRSPAAAIAAAVPRVATSVKPSSCSSRATSTALGLSLGLTLMKTLPDFGSARRRRSGS